MTIQRPRFKHIYCVETVDSVGVFLIAEDQQVVLENKLYLQLAPYLDGTLTGDEIVEQLRDRVDPTQIYYALIQLERRGLIVEADASIPGGVAAFWELQGSSGVDARDKLAAATVALRTCGAISAEALQACRTAFAELGLKRVEETGEASGLTMILADDYLQPELAAINGEALRSGRPWMLVRPNGASLWIGPLFRPYETGCWECLAQRLRDNRMVEQFVLKRQERSGPLLTALAALPTGWKAAINLAATEAARWIVTGANARIDGALVSLDASALQTDRHILVRRPQCRACGDPAYNAEREPAPIVLASPRARYADDGGHRVISAEATLERYARHVSPITGAVTRLQRLGDSADSVMHAYIAGHNFALGLNSLTLLRKSLRSDSGGKGKTDAQARASALGEALERYSGVFRGDEIRRRGRFSELRGDAIHPNACMLISEEQYRRRTELNALQRRYLIVPVPFDEDALVEWTPLWSMTEKTFKYLPTAYLYYGYVPAPDLHVGRSMDPRWGDGFAWADSNGNAAGNTLEEAILQGFMELVERDCVALWWHNRVQRPAVDLDSFPDPYITSLQAHLRAHNRDLWVLDISNDLGVPAFAAVSPRTDREEKQQVVVGFGAHFDPTVALLRALTEATQFLRAFEAFGEQDGELVGWDPDATRWWNTASLQSEPYLLPLAGACRTRESFPYTPFDDLQQSVEACQAVAAQHGLEMLVLDQTRPDIGMPVAKVVVPGLRHFWARYGPGRLYDVPVQLGWLPRPNREEDLNPTAVFF